MPLYITTWSSRTPSEAERGHFPVGATVEEPTGLVEGVTYSAYDLRPWRELCLLWTDTALPASDGLVLLGDSVQAQVSVYAQTWIHIQFGIDVPADPTVGQLLADMSKSASGGTLSQLNLGGVVIEEYDDGD